MGDIDYQALEFEYRRPPDLDRTHIAHHPVIVVGAGPIGLTTALDLAQRQVPVLLVDDDYRLSTGSRAICFSKRTLDIWDRLGVGQRMVDKGVSAAGNSRACKRWIRHKAHQAKRMLFLHGSEISHKK